MLDISYKEDRQLIEISCEGKLAFWDVIRNVFEDTAEEIDNIGVNYLRLPVWAFLSSRKSLDYVIRKYKIKPRLDEKVISILYSSMNAEARYLNSTTLPPISEQQLLSKIISEGFYRNLTNQQTRNVIKLCSLGSGATFSVPGAGKTSEALAYYCYSKAETNKLLVVCPKNAFAAWEEQVSLCINPLPKISRLVGGEKSIIEKLNDKAEIYLITYQQLTNVVLHVAEFLNIHPTFMFLDESHRIKRGAGGVWCSAVLSLAHLPIGKLIMSGTPLPNSVDDLVPQFNFVFPEVDASSENIRDLIKPIFVRTTKGELGLPAVNRIQVPIHLLPNQRNLYELLRSEVARQICGLNPRDKAQLRNIGKHVIRLLQIVSNPALLLHAAIGLPEEIYMSLAEGDSPKIEYACNKARGLAKSGQKTLIWSNFVENVELIASRLSDIGADFIHGGVETGSEEADSTREKKIKSFHEDDKAFVLVANPAACAESISLHTVCHHAIYIDRNYNAAQYLQSEDRIHRLGLPPNIVTTVEILYSPDTIDESISRRLNLKVSRMAKILDDSSLNIEAMAPEFDTDGIDGDDINDLMEHLQRA